MSLSPASILYDSSGTEKGTGTNPVRTDPTGTTTQPVSDGGASLTVDGAVTVSGTVTATGPLTDAQLRASAVVVDGSAVTQPVSGTVTANQGSPNTAANSWPIKITDGTSTAAVKPASTAPLATDQALVTVISPNQTSLPVTLTATPGVPSYYLRFDRIAPAQNKWMGVLFNPAASGKILKVRRIYVLNWQAATNAQSATLDQYLARVSSLTGGTAETVRKFDTNDPNSTASAAHGGTSTQVEMIRRFFASTAQINFSNSNWFNALAFAVNGGIFIAEGEISPIILREGQGLGIYNLTNSTSGGVSYIFEWQEAAL